MRSSFPGLAPVLTIAAIAACLACLAGCGLLDDQPAGDTIVNVGVIVRIDQGQQPPPTPGCPVSTLTGQQTGANLATLTIESELPGPWTLTDNGTALPGSYGTGSVVSLATGTHVLVASSAGCSTNPLTIEVQ